MVATNDEIERLEKQYEDLVQRHRAESRELRQKISDARWKEFGAPFNVGDTVRSRSTSRLFVIDEIDAFADASPTIMGSFVRANGTTSTLPQFLGLFDNFERCDAPTPRATTTPTKLGRK